MTELQSLISAVLAMGGATAFLGVVQAIRQWKQREEDHERMVGVLMGQRVLPQAKVPVRRAPPPPPPAHGGVPVATARAQLKDTKAELKATKERVSVWLVGLRSLELQMEVEAAICRHADVQIVQLSDKTIVACFCPACGDVQENEAWLACQDLR